MSLSQRLKREPFAVPTAEDAELVIKLAELAEAFQAAEQALYDAGLSNSVGDYLEAKERRQTAMDRLLEINLT